MTGNPLFCGIELARRIEAAEAELITAATLAARARGGWGLTLPVGGGYACAAEPGSPMNKVVGLGIADSVDAAAITAVEDACADLGVDVQVELSSLADPAVAQLLTERGYVLVGFENVLGCAPADTPTARADQIDVRRDGGLDAWADALVDGFAHPDGVGVGSHEEFPRGVVENAVRDIVTAGARTYLAESDGQVAGAAGMRLTGGVAQLTGAATVPAFRRRGVQTRLLATRLTDAAAAGCDIAVVTTAPGSTSQKNVQRRGFHLLYTRAILVRRCGPARTTNP